MSPTTVSYEKKATLPPFGDDVEKFVSNSGTDSLEPTQRPFGTEAERAVVRKLDRRVVGWDLELPFIFHI